MALSIYATLDAVTVGTTELSIISGTTSLQSKTDDGIYQLWLDPVTNLALGDSFLLKVVEKTEATGGAQKVIFRTTISHVQSELLVLPSLMLTHGWDMTLQNLTGTDRAFDATVRGVATTISEPYELDGVTVSTTEISIVSGTTTTQSITDDGMYQVFVDAFALAKADDYRVRGYEKVKSAGTQRQFFEAALQDGQAETFVTPPLPLMNGWDWRLIKIAGTDRAIDASIRKIA